VSVAGSIVLDAIVATTHATVGVGAQLDQVAPPPRRNRLLFRRKTARWSSDEREF